MGEEESTMRTRPIGSAVLLSAVAIATPAAAEAGVSGSGTKRIKCHVESHIQTFPTVSSVGTDFSFVSCPAPFGRGLQYSTIRMTPKTPTTGMAVLKFKAFFDDGSVSGVWRATYRFTNATTGLFKQKEVSWTSGTGAFKHVRATGTGSGVLRGTLGEINQVLTVTGI
jgi:hypothetical protein